MCYYSNASDWFSSEKKSGMRVFSMTCGVRFSYERKNPREDQIWVSLPFPPMAQVPLAARGSPSKSAAASASACPFLITDCDDDDSGSNTAGMTSSSSTAGTPTKRRFGYSRQEKSLGTLTRRFMSLLRQSKTGVMDLKHVSSTVSLRLVRLHISLLASQVADSLATKQKRRIYDITNVLEGIGLIEKQSKNTIRWKYVLERDQIQSCFFLPSQRSHIGWEYHRSLWTSEPSTSATATTRRRIDVLERKASFDRTQYFQHIQWQKSVGVGLAMRRDPSVFRNRLV